MPAQLVQVGPSPADVMLRRARNWPLVGAALLGALVLFVASLFIPPGDVMSLMLADGSGALLLLVALAAWKLRREVEISVSRRCIVLRRGLGTLCRQRQVSFDRIRAVRLVQIERHGRHRSEICFVADSEDFDCPTTAAPRQQALLLAMTLSVRLERIWQGTTPTAPEQRIHQLTGTT